MTNPAPIMLKKAKRNNLLWIKVDKEAGRLKLRKEDFPPASAFGIPFLLSLVQSEYWFLFLKSGIISFSVPVTHFRSVTA